LLFRMRNSSFVFLYQNKKCSFSMLFFPWNYLKEERYMISVYLNFKRQQLFM